MQIKVEEPTKVELQIAKHVRFKTPKKSTVMNKEAVDYFVGRMIWKIISSLSKHGCLLLEITSFVYSGRLVNHHQLETFSKLLMNLITALPVPTVRLTETLTTI